MKLSIVLTVYNKKPYLHRALDGLLFQTGVNKSDYEILAVNDGSTDGSESIIDEYVRDDSRVRILNQSNQGLSMARNNGTEEALGEYVWFVDADDIVSPDAVRLICEATSFNPDVIPIYACTDGIDQVRNRITPHLTTGKDVLVDNHWQHCGVFYVYKRNYLSDNKLRFFPGIYHEDAEFTPRMLYFAKSVKVIPKVLYTVYRDPDSITQVPRAKRAYDYLTVAERLSSFLKNNNEEKTQIGRVINDNIGTVINNSFAIICQNGKQEQVQLNNLFNQKRKVLLPSLRNSIQIKYKIESFLLGCFPKHSVQVYKLLKRLSGSSISY